MITSCFSIVFTFFYLFFFFFFSSRRRHTRSLCDWSSDVCSSDLVAIYDSLDTLIRTLAIDEMGMSGQAECIPKLIGMLQDDHTTGFARVKAIEALGRLRATAASPLLQHILETKQV